MGLRLGIRRGNQSGGGSRHRRSLSQPESLSGPALLPPSRMKDQSEGENDQQTQKDAGKHALIHLGKVG